MRLPQFGTYPKTTLKGVMLSEAKHLRLYFLHVIALGESVRFFAVLRMTTLFEGLGIGSSDWEHAAL